MKPAVLLMLTLGLLCTGCTTQAWYEGARMSAESGCSKLPPGAYEDCMARVNRKPYETYEKERRGQ